MKPSLSLSDLKSLNSQAWADFKAHWPMEVFYGFLEIGGGFLFGVALGLSSLVFVLSSLLS